jgi:hypothetical protein
LKYEVLDKVAALMTAAFGLVAALAWNDAIKSLFAEGGPLYFMASYGIWVYAILVTVIAVFATIWIGKMAEKAKKEEKA